ncbi:MAG: lytic transglycosylase domain-containing protein [Rothia sp. (in: high G+C Gram-positive bacteria)]|uniref:lytic transglycosylase domain-containing protein n=1 Tax=Rothia sp. (in: high G+C Gram-positive bacteria) TaxID=1885016 RepID=UPI0026E02A0D|nr:lytic transglycosylase domain-containing protein [Rothia sp. (in: high G+C Gram-positive bacteria)]MDO5750463.1 lytic transglycosylase domain-containing protein [Rothia sp. (in: high G+C Gram-positive bacteria)]
MTTDSSVSSSAPVWRRVVAGVLAHWQIIASAVLLSGGVAGLAATHTEHCAPDELFYAPSQVRADIEQAARVSGFRPGLIAAQLEVESGWRVNARSSADAQGVAQFTEDTWDMWGNGGDRLNPHDAIAAQGRYLAYLRERLAPYAHSEAQLQDIIFAGYNAGPGAVEQYEGIPPYGETQSYVVRIRAYADSKYAAGCVPDPEFTQARLITIPSPSSSASASAKPSSSASVSSRPSASSSASGRS